MLRAKVTRSLDKAEHDDDEQRRQEPKKGGSFQNEARPGAGAIRFGQGSVGEML